MARILVAEEAGRSIKHLCPSQAWQTFASSILDVELAICIEQGLGWVLFTIQSEELLHLLYDQGIATLSTIEVCRYSLSNLF